MMPPVYRERLTHLVIQDEHGKPVALPQRVDRKPQGVPRGLRVEDEGESEGHSVTEWIGIEENQHHPTRKRADFPLVFDHGRT